MSRAGHKYYALVVGIGVYKRLPPLLGARPGAEEIAQTLQQQGYTVTTLFDKEVTTDALNEAIEELFIDRKVEDVFFFYFGGYGYTFEQQVFLATTNFNPDLVQHGSASGFPLSTLRDSYLPKTRAQNVMLILDCCYAGGFSQVELLQSEEKRLEELIKEIVEGPTIGRPQPFANKVVITATGRYRETPDSMAASRSLLVTNLLPLLRGDPEVIETSINEEGYLTSTRLKDYLGKHWITPSPHYQGDYAFEDRPYGPGPGLILGYYPRTPLLYNAPFDVKEEPATAVGHQADKQWLIDKLSATEPPAVVGVYGIGGIGKTVLAQTVACFFYKHGRFPDGIVFQHCEGQTEALDVLRDVLSRFDPRRQRPSTTDPAELTAIAQRLLYKKKALVILNHIEPELDIAMVTEPLQAAGAPLLLTARQQFPRRVVSPANSRKLEALSAPEALALFKEALGWPSLTADELAAAQQIIEALGSHASAIQLAGGYAAQAYPDIGAFARDLQKDLSWVLALQDNDLQGSLGLEFILAKSVDTLPAQTQRLFTALAAFATAEFGRYAILSLAQAIGLSKDEASQSLMTLVQRVLVTLNFISTMPEGGDRERFRLQPLLRAFAKRHLATWSQDEQQLAQQAIATHYASYVNNEKVPWGARRYDERNIAGALKWAHDQQEDELIAELCSGMQRFWLERGRIEDALRYLPWGITAAEARAGTIDARAAGLHLTYGTVLQHTGRRKEAEDEFNRIRTIRVSETLNALGEIALSVNLVTAEDFFNKSLEIARSENNQEAMGRTLSNLGRLALRRWKLDTADILFQESLSMGRTASDKGWDMVCLGEVALYRGQLDEAGRYDQQSLDIFQAEQNRFNEAIALYSLGRIALYRGRLDEAERYHQQSLALRHEIQYWKGEAWDTASLGEIAQLRGHFQEAKKLYQQSLDISDQIQDWRGKGVFLSYLGKLALLQEQLDEAERYWQQSLFIRREIGDRREEGWDLLSLGQIAEQRGDLDEAERFYRESLAIRREANINPDTASSLRELGRFLIEKRGNREEGCSLLIEAIQLYPEQWIPGLATAGHLPVEIGVPAKEQARRMAQVWGCPI